MRLCQIDDKISFFIEGFCDMCPDEIGDVKLSARKVTSISEVVPKGLCPFAYFSIIPYWVSFKQGAWFRWRTNKNDVVCQCPSTNGVVFLVKKNSGPEKLISVEVVSVGVCPYQHKVKQTFQIVNDILCSALFPSFWIQIDKIIKKGQKEVKVQCCVSSNFGIIKIE